MGWAALERGDRRLILACGVLFFLRLVTLGQSGFGYYLGINEANYASIARSLDDDVATPRLDGRPFYDLPPLTPYAIRASFLIFGPSEFAARLPSLLMEPLGLLGLYACARALYGAPVARAATALFATMPFTLLWYGRAQTDSFATSFLLLSMAGFILWDRRRWATPAGGIFLGLAAAARQVAILAIPLTLAYALGGAIRRDQKNNFLRGAILWSSIGALPILAWLGYQWLHHRDALTASLAYQSTTRTALFANVDRDLLIGLGIGAAPMVLLFAAYGAARSASRGRDLFTWWFIAYAGFAFLRAPDYHEYYMLPALPALAIWAARGIHTAAKMRPDRPRTAQNATLLVATTSLIVGILLLGLAGDLGDRTVPDAAQTIKAQPGPAEVHVRGDFAPQFRYYLRDLPHHVVRSYVAEPPANLTAGSLIVWPTEGTPGTGANITLIHEARYDFLTTHLRQAVYRVQA